MRPCDSFRSCEPSVLFKIVTMLKVLCVLIVVSVVSGQYVESPCPGVFEYRTDGSGVYGLIHVRSNRSPVSTVRTMANFSIATRLPSSYVGRLEPVNNSPQLLQSFNNGAALQYRVDFPVTSPLPRVTSIAVNDNVLCYGPADIPGPGQYVTTINLLHTLFLKGQSNPGYFNQYERPQAQQKPDEVFQYFGQLPDNTQVFTFGDDNLGSWNSINYPNKHPNEHPEYQPSGYERPQYQQPTTTTPRPHRPQQYYPEQTTKPPAPPRDPFIQNVYTTAPPRFTQRVPQSPQASGPGTSSVQCGVVSGGNERQPLIYNGQSYARGDWPWLVAIYKRKDGGLTFICSGTLVSNRHVVTAAHCMQQKDRVSSIKDIVLKVGVYNLEDWGDDVVVTRTVIAANIHSAYNASSLANDILVVTFDKSVEFNTNIRPACLWSGNADLSRIVGASGVVAGWGQSEMGPAGRGEPRVVRIPVVSTAVCRASRPDFHKLTSSNTLCAGDRIGSGPCLGDSGGGLYLLEGGRWRLRGVVSLSLKPDNGDSTCNLNEYVVFTDSAQYLRWIESIIAS